MDMNYGGGNVGGRGVGRMEWSGGEWDNCNSIINKYIKKINSKNKKKGEGKGANYGDVGRKQLRNSFSDY